MTIPHNVQDYWDARWWVYFHYQLPITAIAFLAITTVKSLREYSSEDDREQKSQIVSLDLTEKKK